MYLIGRADPLQLKAQAVLQDLVRARRRLVTSAEVLQEICHRYQAIKKIEFIRPCFDVIDGIVDQIFPITKQDVEESLNLLLGYKGLSARDALHIAVMRNLGIKEILSLDEDFDEIPWITRLS